MNAAKSSEGKININVESCNTVHGHNRNGELIDSLKRGSAKIVLHAVNSEPAAASKFGQNAKDRRGPYV